MTGAVVMAATVSLPEGYCAPSCQVSGGARTAFLRAGGFSLWRVDARLDTGATVTWGETHGDEALYVLDGEIEIDGRPCGPAGAVIVEAGVGASMRVLAPTNWLHFGPGEAVPPADGPFGPPAGDTASTWCRSRRRTRSGPRRACRPRR